MSRFYAICASAVFLLAVDFSHSSPEKFFKLKVGGWSRSYAVYLPESAPKDKPLPVVIGFHGALGTWVAQKEMSQMNPVADKHGFLVVYPNGTGKLKKRLTFNAGICCAYAYRKKVDDVAFVRALLDDVSKNYRIDPERIYATGMSNGGMMTYKVACDLSDRIAAVAPVAGGAKLDCPNLKRPVPLMHFHGMDDRIYPFDGDDSSWSRIRQPHYPVMKLLEWWAEHNKSLAPPRIVQMKGYDIVEFARNPKEVSAPVVLYKVIGGGHTWPGGKDLTKNLGTGPMTTAFQASEVMWEFFKQFTLSGGRAE